MRLILASTSQYRRAQLDALGIDYIAVAPGVDEETLKDHTLSPTELARLLAAAKAQSLKAGYPDDIIIGGDQLVAFNGQILGKAGSPEQAAKQLLSMAGQWHELITALYMVIPQEILTRQGHAQEHFDDVITTRVLIRPLTPEQAKSYVEQDKSWDCAGSYKIERGGYKIIERLECEDHSAIVGLPLQKLCQHLWELKFQLL